MLGLDLSNVTENGGTIPAGRYLCVVEKAEVKPTRTAGGEYIWVQYKIIDGPYNGRAIFEQFNIRNANAQAVQIGLGQLKAFLKASGFKNPNRLESATELLGLKVVVSTKVETDATYGENTRVKGYGPVNGTATAPGPMGQAVATAAAAAGNPFA